MAYTNTTLLGLNQPTTGQESGVWGDDVNNGFTQLVDLAVAGTNNITQDSDITLTVSNGNNSSSFTSTATNSTVAQYYILNCTGSRTAARNIIAPATSRSFVITNGTTGGYAITIKKTAGTGVSIAAGETAVVFYNTVTGDYVKATSISTSGVVLPANGGTGIANGTNNTITFTGNYTLGLTLTGNTAVTFPTSGTLQTTTGSLANNTGLPLTTGVTGTLPVANGGTNLTSFTANGVVYASSTSALATGSNLVFDGNNLGIGTSSPSSPLSISTSNGSIVSLNSTNTNGGYLGIQKSGTAVGYIGSAAQLSGGSATDMTLRADTNLIFTSNGSSERMRLNTSGYLGIGTSSPSVALEVAGASKFTNGNVSIVPSTTTSAAAFIATNGGGTFFVGLDNSSGSTFGAGAYGSVLYNGANTPMVFYTNGSERMRLDTSGNLGIGTTSPSYALDVASSTIRIGSTASNGIIIWGTSDVARTGLNSSTEYRVGWGRNSSINLTFLTNDTERMRIDSSGNVLVGTTSVLNSGKFSLYQTNNSFAAVVQNTSSSVSGAYGIQVNLTQDPNTTDSFFYKGTGNATDRFYVRANGGIGNYQANNVNLSDQREKKNIQLAPSYLNKICQIPVKTFLFNDQTDTELNLGAIAQDVQAVCPELVHESNWGSKEEPKMRLSIYQTDLQYALMKCIQELSAKVTALEAKLGV
jgi:Chaperone of endosialidase